MLSSILKSESGKKVSPDGYKLVSAVGFGRVIVARVGVSAALVSSVSPEIIRSFSPSLPWFGGGGGGGGGCGGVGGFGLFGW